MIQFNEDKVGLSCGAVWVFDWPSLDGKCQLFDSISRPLSISAAFSAQSLPLHMSSSGFNVRCYGDGEMENA